MISSSISTSASAFPRSHSHPHSHSAPPTRNALIGAAAMDTWSAMPMRAFALARSFASTAATKAISKGEQIPNTTFSYVPWAPELADGTACGAPTKIQTHDAFKGKKVVIVAVPGAYTRKFPPPPLLCVFLFVFVQR